MRQLKFAAAVVVALLIGTSLVAQKRSGPDGAFQSAMDYVISGQWVFTRSSNPVCLEGATNNTYETCLNASDPTADRVLTLPDATGTLSAMGVTNVTGSSVTVTAAYAGRTITLNRAAGIAVTLPAATGTGNIYRFVVGTTFTGDATIKVASATDYMIGVGTLYADAGDTVLGFATANTGTVGTESDTVDLFDTGNVTGGIKGAYVELTDIGTAQWAVRYVSDAAGTEATPFKVTVS